MDIERDVYNAWYIEQFEIDLGREILEDGGEVHRSVGTEALSVSFGLQESGDPTHGEFETGFAAPRGTFCCGWSKCWELWVRRHWN